MIQHPFCSYKKWGWEGKYWLRALLVACPYGAQFWSVYFLRSYPGAAGSLGKVLTMWLGISEASEEDLGGDETRAKCLERTQIQKLWLIGGTISGTSPGRMCGSNLLGRRLRVAVLLPIEGRYPAPIWETQTCESYWRFRRGMIERISTPSLFHF